MDDLLAQLQLIRTPGIGPVTYYHLLGLHKTARQALAALEAEKPQLKLADPLLLHKEMKACEKEGIWSVLK